MGCGEDEIGGQRTTAMWIKITMPILAAIAFTSVGYAFQQSQRITAVETSTAMMKDLLVRVDAKVDRILERERR